MTKQPEGSIAMSLAVIIFLAALAAAAFVTWRLKGTPWQMRAAVLLPPPSPSSNDLLELQVSINPELEQYRPQLIAKLVTPMRQYYATKAERLGNISIEPSDVGKYAAKVSVAITADSGAQNRSFYFGSVKDNKTDFIPWDPGFFDRTK